MSATTIGVPGTRSLTPWAESSDAVAAGLGADQDRGLSGPEAAQRLLTAGPNEVPRQRHPGIWRSVVNQLLDAMILVLLAAGALTLVTGDLADAAVIFLVVTVNTITGAWQERRALVAIDALSSLAAPVALVRRDGAVASIDAAQVVPGDVLVLREGDVVAADARLLEADDLEVDESLLTGESLPVRRDATAVVAPETPIADRVGMVHGGTLVVRGSGTAVATATGLNSCIGGISRLLQVTQVPVTPLQRRLGRLGRRLSLVVVGACAVVALLGVLRGQSLELVLVTAISLAVAAIPESLPAVVALSLASGARRMARRGAIVRSLSAVETLGSVTVLASDKTGTLTTGEMVVVATWTPAGGEQELGTGDDGPGLAQALAPGALARGAAGRAALLSAAVLCSDAETDSGAGSFTELALVQAAAASGVQSGAVRAEFPRTGVVPFDRERRDMSTTHSWAQSQLVITKGAPEQVLAGLTVPAEAHDRVSAWAGAGRRVIAVSVQVDDRPPELLGLAAIADPVKPEAAQAIGACTAAGITTVLITGDHPGTAAAIARQTGMLAEPAGGAADVGARIYARADPGTKLDLVGTWQRNGEVVAMTGDGVNDAPALQAADIGVAMGRRGTDVARNAANLVLTDDSLATIVVAVAEGRRVYDNIRRFVRYGLAGGGAEILVMVLGPFLGLPLPLLAGQILWINLLTHGLPGVAIGAEQAEPDVLQRVPRPPSEPILTRQLATQTGVLAVALATVSLSVAVWAHRAGLDWQTALFATLALGQLGVALTTRSDARPAWRIPLRGNPMLMGTVSLSVVLVAAAIYLPPLQALLRTVALPPGVLLVAAAAATIPAAVAQAGVLLHRPGVHRPGVHGQGR